jgi:photosystem II stability/assembly factor-like uncharacterized protein
VPLRSQALRGAAALVALVAVGSSAGASVAAAIGAGRVAAVAPTIENLSQLALDGSRDGYGLFVTSSGRSCRTYVAKTTDGGAKFSAPVHLNGCNMLIAADSSGDVFVYGKQLFVSHDGGSTFSRLPSFSDVDQIVTVGSSVWLATAVCSTTTAVSCPLRLYLSSNGGASWSLAREQPTGAVGWAGGGGGTYLVRVGPAQGWVLSHPPTSSRKSALYYTTNSGQTWANRTLPCPKGVVGYFNATASPHGAFWASCANVPDGQVQLKSVEVSLDEGATWKSGATCRTTSELLCQGLLAGIAAISWHSAWIVSEHGELLVTHDAGKTWTWVSPIGDAKGGVSSVQVQFFNEKVGVASGTAPSGRPVLLWWTDNGGTTWKVTRPSF